MDLGENLSVERWTPLQLLTLYNVSGRVTLSKPAGRSRCHCSSWGSSTQAPRGSRNRGSEAEVSEVPPQSWAFSCEPRAFTMG